MPAGALPPVAACSPYVLTLSLQLDYTVGDGASAAPTSHTALIPVSVTPTCPEPAAGSASAGGRAEALAVRISRGAGSDARYAHTSATALPFLVDFGGAVVGQDPLALVQVRGANRTDMVLDLDRGQVSMIVYVTDSTQPSTIT